VSERLCAVSVDLDEIPCYAAIHGLPTPSGPSAQAVYRHALPRLIDLFDALDLPATFFAIGRDLAHDHVRDSLRGLAQRGHEIGNHSQDHLYDLTRRSRPEMIEQVSAASRAIAAAIGGEPRGFRAPGYTINDSLASVLSELGFAYDSSVFPCPAYYLAKSAAITTYRLASRPTHSIIDHPRVLRAPAEPYRMGAHFAERGTGLLELPIGVTRDLTGRLPYIGTYLALSGELGARMLSKCVIGRGLVNLELHGIDAADADLDGLSALRPYQPDLRRSAVYKLAALKSALQTLRAHGYRFVTLAQAANHFADKV
jgi:peptidoglycan/xylan/chitin deacetylase (PgdA/CDA1 family)